MHIFQGIIANVGDCLGFAARGRVSIFVQLLHSALDRVRAGP